MTRLSIVPGALILAAIAVVPVRHSAGARWGADYFPNVSLTTQDGKVVRFYDDLLKDKIVAIDLVYTNCRYVCPLETARLAQVQRLLGNRVGSEIFFYSISIDPKRDTPEVLKAYAQKFHVAPGWLFLTGQEDDIRLVTKKLGLSFQPSTDGRDGHTAELMIGNVATGQWMRNSAIDNPRFLATMIGEVMDGWNTSRGEPSKSYAHAPTLSIKSRGQYLFATRCAACHTLGQGDGIGPDLLGVTRARKAGWLARFLAAPDRMLADGDPIAKALYSRYKIAMPNLRLAAGEVSALLEYLAALPAAAPDDGASRGAPAAVPSQP